MKAASIPLAAQVAAFLQQSTDPMQIEFERHIQCPKSLERTNRITEALEDRHGSVALALSLPSSILPPMF